MTLPDKCLAELKDSIKRDVTVGLLPESEIVSQHVELFSDEYDTEALRYTARGIVRATVERHQQEQKFWPTTTDCDRLDAAFAALEASGILCRQDCAPCEDYCEEIITDEIRAMECSGRDVRGYAYITMLATDDALSGKGLEIRFGAWPTSHITEGDIGLEVAAALQRQGLMVSWDGGRVTPIHITMDWKKRRLQGF